jgi:hypothetical protein
LKKSTSSKATFELSKHPRNWSQSLKYQSTRSDVPEQITCFLPSSSSSLLHELRSSSQPRFDLISTERRAKAGIQARENGGISKGLGIRFSWWIFGRFCSTILVGSLESLILEAPVTPRLFLGFPEEETRSKCLISFPLYMDTITMHLLQLHPVILSAILHSHLPSLSGRHIPCASSGNVSPLSLQGFGQWYWTIWEEGGQERGWLTLLYHLLKLKPDGDKIQSPVDISGLEAFRAGNLRTNCRPSSRRSIPEWALQKLIEVEG